MKPRLWCLHSGWTGRVRRSVAGNLTHPDGRGLSMTPYATELKRDQASFIHPKLGLRVSTLPMVPCGDEAGAETRSVTSSYACLREMVPAAGGWAPRLPCSGHTGDSRGPGWIPPVSRIPSRTVREAEGLLHRDHPTGGPTGERGPACGLSPPGRVPSVGDLEAVALRSCRSRSWGARAGGQCAWGPCSRRGRHGSVPSAPPR